MQILYIIDILNTICSQMQLRLSVVDKSCTCIRHVSYSNSKNFHVALHLNVSYRSSLKHETHAFATCLTHLKSLTQSHAFAQFSVIPCIPLHFACVFTHFTFVLTHFVCILMHFAHRLRPHALFCLRSHAFHTFRISKKRHFIGESPENYIANTRKMY